MIANLKKLLNPQAPELVAVLLNRSLLIDGEAFSKGDTVSVSPKTARDLCSDGSATDAKADAAAHEKAAKLSALLPPPIEPLPVPDSWKNMPEVFHKWHQLNESGRVLRDRADEMEDRLIQRAKRYVFHGDLGGISVGIASAHDRNRVLSAVGNAIQVGDIPEHELDETRYMEGAHLRLRKAFSDWLEMHQAEAIKLSFLCGDEVQARHSELCETLTELHKTALDIFTERTSFLGLAAQKTKELFAGSADFIRYCQTSLPSLGNLRLAWSEKGSDPRLYIDSRVSTMVGILAGFDTKLAEAKKQLKLAKSELKQTQKAA